MGMRGIVVLGAMLIVVSSGNVFASDGITLEGLGFGGGGVAGEGTSMLPSSTGLNVNLDFLVPKGMFRISGGHYGTGAKHPLPPELTEFLGVLPINDYSIRWVEGTLAFRISQSAIELYTGLGPGMYSIDSPELFAGSSLQAGRNPSAQPGLHLRTGVFMVINESFRINLDFKYLIIKPKFRTSGGGELSNEFIPTWFFGFGITIYADFTTEGEQEAQASDGYW